MNQKENYAKYLKREIIFKQCISLKRNVLTCKKKMKENSEIEFFYCKKRNALKSKSMV